MAGLARSGSEGSVAVGCGQVWQVWRGKVCSGRVG